MNQRVLSRYETPGGKTPFSDWLRSLKDRTAASRIRRRLNRLELGNLGASRPVGQGVCELKLDFGPGYRIYLGQYGETIIILLCGGDKSTQEEDIRLAKTYWEDFRRRNHEGE